MSMGDLREYGGRVIMGAMYYAIPFFFYYKNVNKHSPFLFFSLLIFCCVFLKAAMILNMAKKSKNCYIYFSNFFLNSQRVNMGDSTLSV